MPIAAVVLGMLLPAAGAATAAAGTDPSRPSASVVAPPQPVPATDKRTHLVYEILLRNPSAQPIRLDRVQVRDAQRRRVVADHDRRAIERLLQSSQGQFTSTLGPGESGLLLLDVRLPAGDPVPTRLTHRFRWSLDPTGDAPERLTITDAATGVDKRRPARLSPPLRGSDLAVLGCCGPPFGHRQALFDFDGRLFLAQRYAIDFLQLDDGLQTFDGDPANNQSYFIFGDDVTAVAPGRVLAVRDGVPENVPPNVPPDPGVEDLTGNFVVQSLGGGYAALYAHLQTGSVRVRPGDQLGRGELLGQVGNTGNSSEPHLHFQVTDDPGLPSGLAANGVPYVFDRFVFESRIVGLDSDPPALERIPAPPPPRRAGQYPLTGDVVDFP
jgi:Peptidase family M23